MAFPPQFLDDIRNRLSLASVVGRVVRLTRKGREHSGICPFHNEKTPSFTVNEEKGFFHCFGCGAHGDMFSFVARTQNLSFPEAVERLAGEAGLEMPRQSPEEREQAKRQASLYDVVEATCAFYEKSLQASVGREGLAYLERRGLDEATISRFRLGYAPEGRDALARAILKDGVSAEMAIEAGVLGRREEGGELFDRFRGRVIFPITDKRGRVVAFGGRTLGDNQPKYLNSPDGPLFHKGRMLYGLAQARRAAIDANEVVAVEGYMDVIALAKAGFAQTVAPLGTALTEAQMEELWRLAPEPILCFDGDNAGQRAAARALGRALPLLQPGRSLRFAVLPAKEDPDSLVRAKGLAAFRAILDGAKPLHLMLWEMETTSQPLDTPERRAALESRLDGHVREIADRSVQENYKKIFKEMVWNAFRPPRSGGAAGSNWQGKWRKAGQAPLAPAQVRSRPKLPETGRGRFEKALLAAVIYRPELLEFAAERLGMAHFADADLDKLREAVLMHPDEGFDLDFQGLQRHLAHSGFSQVLDSLLDSATRAVLAAFAQPDRPLDEARTAWDQAFERYRSGDYQAETFAAETEAASDLSDATLARLRAVKEQMPGILNRVGPDEDG